MKISALAPSLLLALASLIYIYAGGASLVSPIEIFRPILFVWLFLLLLFPLAYWLTRDWDWAGLLLGVIVLGLLSRPRFTYVYLTILLVVLLLLFLTNKFLFNKTLEFRQMLFVINTLSIVSIASTSMFLAQGFEAVPVSYYRSILDVLQSKKYVPLKDENGLKPDIYYIVLDGYGRQDMLQQLYGFDNSEFVDGLQRAGFIVPEKSRANYPRTVLSLASTLNMNYIESFAPQLERSDTNILWLLSPWLDHNLVRTSLEKIGYSSVSISTNWSYTDNATTDYYFKSHPIILTDFERYIFSVTPLMTFLPFLQDLISVPTYDALRQSQLNNFTSLIQSTDIESPKFVFAHILLPHPPFVFNRDGSPTNPAYTYNFTDSLTDYRGSAKQYRQQYKEQAQFLNGQLEQVIESILQNSNRPPIIILQADHGPRMLTDYASLENTCLMEGFSNFSAYYLPGMDPGKIPDDITPVNIFRIIFNEYFDAGLPLLENEQYYPGGETDYYQFINVTSIVDRRENCSIE